MKFYLQQGSGMLQFNEEYAQEEPDVGFILSPRALNKNTEIGRIKKHANALKNKGAEVLFDPQFYEPRTNMSKILRFPYFNEDSEDYMTQDFLGTGAKTFAEKAIIYQERELGVSSYIIPGIYTNSLSEDWLELFDNMFYGGKNSGDSEKIYYQTIALGKDAILSDNFDDFIGQCALSSVDGYYIVLKKPAYINDDLLYLYKVLDALISIKLSGKKIIMGYGNQQDIMFTGAGIDGFATGNYQNVRSFDPDVFFEAEESIKKKSKWYFDENTFSEYKLPQLDLAFRRGFKDKFGPKNSYNEVLLNSDSPTSVAINWSEKLSFKNYFSILNNICVSQKDRSLSERMNFIRELFESKKQNVDELSSLGIRIEDKGFSSDALEATLGAIDSIISDRKFDLDSFN